MWVYCIFISAIATIIDLNSKKIPNIITLPSIVIGLFINYLFFGFSSMLEHLVSVMIVFGLFFVPFYINALGAGDIKLLMAVAAFIPRIYMINVIIVFAIAGAAMSLLVIIMQRRVLQGLKNVKYYLLQTIMCQKVDKIENKNHDHYVAFSLPIFISVIAVYMMKYYV